MSFKYEELYMNLKTKILAGDVRYGDKLPTEHDLIETFGVSQITVRNALKRLVDEGLIERAARRGSICVYNEGRYRNRKILAIMPEKTKQSDLYMEGLHSVISTYGIGCDEAYTSFNSAKEIKLMTEAQSNGYLGLIINPSLKTANDSVWTLLSKNSFPSISYDNYSTGINYNSVSSNGFKGCMDSTQYLIDQGHVRIAFYSNYTKASSTMRQRYYGYLEALKTNNIKTDPSIVYLVERDEYTYLTVSALNKYCDKILEDVDNFTAIVCGNDYLAEALILRARVRNISIPSKLSIVGFDDIPFSSYKFTPPLTTIRQPFRDMGVASGEMMINIIDGKQKGVYHVQLDGELIIRMSVKRRK